MLLQWKLYLLSVNNFAEIPQIDKACGDNGKENPILTGRYPLAEPGSAKRPTSAGTECWLQQTEQNKQKTLRANLGVLFISNEKLMAAVLPLLIQSKLGTFSLVDENLTASLTQ